MNLVVVRLVATALFAWACFPSPVIGGDLPVLKIDREVREVVGLSPRELRPVALVPGCKIHTALGVSAGSARFTLRALEREEFEIGRSAGSPPSVTLFEEAVEKGPVWRDVVIEVPSEVEGSLAFEVEAGVAAQAAWARPIVRCPRDAWPKERRNVLLFSLDTLRADRLGVYGNTHGLTPNLDAYSRRGTRFSRTYSTYPNTLVSHASMFTGLRPRDFGSLDEVRLGGRDTLAGRFAAAGYATTAFTENAFVGSAFGFGQGFYRYDDGPPPPKGKRIPSYAERTFSAGRDWLRSRPAGPYFLFLHTYEVHAPYEPSAELRRQFWWKYNRWHFGPQTYEGLAAKLNLWSSVNIRRDTSATRQLELLYDAKVQHLDRLFGELMAELEREGHLENTVVVVTSDHGEAFMEHGIHGHGKTLETQALEVPLFVVAPGLVPAGGVVPRLSSLIDLAPTIADLAGIDHEFEGGAAQTLAPLVLGKASLADVPAYSELFASRAACDPPSQDMTACPFDGVSVRDDEFTYIHSAAIGQELLYDTRVDPGEAVNVAADRRDVVAKYAALAAAYRGDSASPLSGAGGSGAAPLGTATLGTGTKAVDDATERKLRALGYID